MKHRRIAASTLAASLVLAVAPASAAAMARTAAARPTPGELAVQDGSNLEYAAGAVEQQAIATGALPGGLPYLDPAKVLWVSVEALTTLAIADDPSLKPTDTTDVMGPVPHHLSHHLKKQPSHEHHTTTHTLSPFVGAIPDSGAHGFGLHRPHDGAWPAPFQPADGVYVDPTLPAASPSTIGLVALRTALKQLGQPYVWAAAGPDTFDCSGLVQWAYAHAGIGLAHHAAFQWNEGRLIPGRDILPGDLVMFGRPIFHVGMYLGSGWMLNAPYTGQYVDVVPVPSHVTGVIRP